MNFTQPTKRKFCILHKNKTSLLTNFIQFSKKDKLKSYSFNNISIKEIEKYAPDAIIIDNYFSDCNYKLLISTIIHNFKHTNIYVISPEYAQYNRVIKSFNCENHIFSNLNENVIQMINSTVGCDPSNYLTAS